MSKSTYLFKFASSPLYQELVHSRQIAQDVATFTLPTEAASIFFLIATAKPGVEARQIQDLLTDRLAEAAADPPPAQEIGRALKTLQTGYYEELQTLDQRADLISQFTTFFDEPERIGSEMDHYVRVESQDLSAFASEYLVPDQRAIVTVIPRGRR